MRVIQELRDLVEQKEQFIALMSHELRTPLNGIIGLSNTLLTDVGGGGGASTSQPSVLPGLGKLVPFTYLQGLWASLLARCGSVPTLPQGLP